MTYKKLETQAQKHPNIGVWEYDLGVVCFEHKDYLPAATHFKKAYSIEAKDVVFSNITDCYYMAGEYDKALEYNEKAIKADSTNIDLYKTKVEILDEMARTAYAAVRSRLVTPSTISPTAMDRERSLITLPSTSSCFSIRLEIPNFFR